MSDDSDRRQAGRHRRGDVIVVRLAAGDQGRCLHGARGQTGRRDLDEIARMCGEAVRQVREPSDQQGDERRVMCEVGVQMRRRVARFPEPDDGGRDLNGVLEATPGGGRRVALREVASAPGEQRRLRVAPRVGEQDGEMFADPLPDGPAIFQETHGGPDLAHLGLDDRLTRSHHAEQDKIDAAPFQRQNLVHDEGLGEPRPAANQIDHRARHAVPLATASPTARPRFSTGMRPGPLRSASCLAIFSQV